MPRTLSQLLPSLWPALIALTVLVLTQVGAANAAEQLKPIVVQPDVDRIDITSVADAYEGRGDSLQIETAAGDDGVSGRMTVRASVPGTSPNWMVFALTNKSDKPLERLLTSDRYTLSGSGIIWPDLDARRIESVTPSVGFVPERIKNDKADVFRLTLEPGQTITYVAELTGRFPRIHLWRPIDYEIKSRDRQLFNGAMLGLTGLLAFFLTSVFAANHKVIFPAGALVSWSVLMYLCVDFGLFHKLFNLRPEDNAVYRAAAEASMAASFVIFLATFLRLSLWHGLVRMLIGVWIVSQITLIAVAVIDPKLASTFARVSFMAVGAVGGVLTLYLAIRGQDRALSLIPPWLLLMVWIFAAGLTLTGRLSGDVMVTSLVSGLVLVVLLIGYAVTQYAFRSLDTVYAGAPNELQGRSLALAASGSTVWEWNIRRDEIKVGPEIEIALALMPGELSTKVDDFLKHVHPTDKERFRLMLLSAQEHAGVRIRTDFRVRHADNSWRWFELEAASVPNSDGRTLRCVGLLRDISDSKRAHERLLHDAVHCSLTGLPNRELFLDRLKGAAARAKTDTAIRPAVMFIDLDKFKSVNSSFGLVRGDSLLITIARRLQRHIGPEDTVARVGGDQFALLFTNERDTRNMGALAERVRRSLRAPIPLANQEIVVTGSIGIAMWDDTQTVDDELFKNAELAMYRAKRAGSDRIEVFETGMRREKDDRIQIESGLRRALEKSQLKVLYQPIVYLPTKELAGFEALVRWDHPKLGILNPVSFLPVAEETDLIVKIGAHVLLRAAKECARWQTELPRTERPLFVSVNISSRQIFRPESVQEIRHVIGRNIVPPGALQLELTESHIMENPEQAVDVLKALGGSGVDLALDDFGTGYSSLAYLQRFPFNKIKVDRELVHASSTGSGAAIMRSIVAMAHEMQMAVVAEGVERADEAAFLRSIGCEYAQGYHFGEPISERDVLHLLKMVRRSESKIQPRGFFRPKFKSGKDSQPSAAPQDNAPESAPAIVAADTQKPKTKSVRNKAAAATAAAQAALSQAMGKAGSLSGTVVRHRHKPAANGPSPSSTGASSGASTGPAQGLPQSPPPGFPNGGPLPLTFAKDGPAVSPPPRPLQPIPPAASTSQPPFFPPPPALQAASARDRLAKDAGPPTQPVRGGPKPPMPPLPAESPPPNFANNPLADALSRVMPGPPPNGASRRPPPGPVPGMPGPVPGAMSSGPGPVPSPSLPNGAAPRMTTQPAQPAAAQASSPSGAQPPFMPIPQTAEVASPDFSALPPGIAASLARLAGDKTPPEKQQKAQSAPLPPIAAKK